MCAPLTSGGDTGKEKTLKGQEGPEHEWCSHMTTRVVGEVEEVSSAETRRGFEKSWEKRFRPRREPKGA